MSRRRQARRAYYDPATHPNPPAPRPARDVVRLAKRGTLRANPKHDQQNLARIVDADDKRARRAARNLRHAAAAKPNGADA